MLPLFFLVWTVVFISKCEKRDKQKKKKKREIKRLTEWEIERKREGDMRRERFKIIRNIRMKTGGANCCVEKGLSIMYIVVCIVYGSVIGVNI